MLLNVIRTARGLVARRYQQDFDGRGSGGGEQLRPLLIALARGGGGGPDDLDRWTVTQLLEGLGRVLVVPPRKKEQESAVGTVATRPLFDDKTLMWLEADVGRLAIQVHPDKGGLLVLDAPAQRLAFHDHKKLARSRKRLDLSNSPKLHRAGDGCWHLDDRGSQYLSVWTPDRAELVLEPDPSRAELTRNADGTWRPVAAPRLRLPGLAWSPDLARWTDAWLQWGGALQPVEVTAAGLEAGRR